MCLEQNISIRIELFVYPTFDNASRVCEMYGKGSNASNVITLWD